MKEYNANGYIIRPKRDEVIVLNVLISFFLPLIRQAAIVFL